MLLLLVACTDKLVDTGPAGDTASDVCLGTPNVTILSPAEGLVATLGASIAFSGEGTSSVGEPLAFLWAVDGDVEVVGATGSWTPVAAGEYQVSFQAQDRCGYGQATVRVSVREPDPVEPAVDVFGVDLGLPAGGWYGLSVAPGGTIWGANAAGLVHLDPATGGVRVYGLADGLLDDAPHAVLAHSDGTVWVGHVGTEAAQGEQVSVGDDGALTVLRVIDYTESSEILAVHRLDEQRVGPGIGDVWMGTNEGLCLFDADLQVFAEHAHPTHPHGDSAGVAFTADGDVWNGDQHQLSRWRYSNDGNLSPSADLAETIPTWPVELAAPIAITDLSAEGQIVWVVSSLFGVARVAVGAEVGTSTVELLGAPYPLTATGVRVDGAGNTWIAGDQSLFVANDAGLTRLEGSWLPVEGVEALAVDLQSDPPVVWVATSAGLVRIVGVPEGELLAVSE